MSYRHTPSPPACDTHTAQSSTATCPRPPSSGDRSSASSTKTATGCDDDDDAKRMSYIVAMPSQAMTTRSPCVASAALRP